MAAAEFRATAL